MATLRRTIHTDLYTEKAAEILERARLFIRCRWGSTQMVRNAKLAQVEAQPNGEFTWNVYNEARNGWRSVYYGNSTYASRGADSKVREWICMILKEICFRQFRQSVNGVKPTAKQVHAMWNRKNDTPVTLMSENINDPDAEKVYANKFGPITVAQIYCVYEKLLNRKRFEKAYSDEIKKLIIGQERDPAATQLELIKREELQKLEQRKAEAKRKLENDRDNALSEARAKVIAEYKQLEADMLKSFEEEHKKLIESLSFMTAVESDPMAAALFG